MNGVVLGIDPSLTGTALTFGTGIEYGEYNRTLHSSTNIGDEPAQRIKRYEKLIASILVPLQGVPIAAVFIEGYSFGSDNSRARYSAEYGGLLRWHMADFTDQIFEVAPTTLKKFATMVGKGRKDQVIAASVREHNFQFTKDDEVDSLYLYHLGLCCSGLCDPRNEKRRECVRTVLGDRTCTVAPPTTDQVAAPF